MTPNHYAEPAIRLTNADYARAEIMQDPYRARRVPGGSVQPRWLSGGRRFWYRVGARHVVVDPVEGTRHDAFDHDRLAAALSVAAGRAVAADDLPITSIDLDVPEHEAWTVRFSAFESRWEWSDSAGSCARVDYAEPLPGEVASPDKAWIAFRRDGDIVVRSRDGAQEFALTEDAEPHFDYGGLPEALGMRALMRNLGLPAPLVVSWSPDSTRLLVHRLDQRDLPEQVLVESAPRDGGRPVEHRSRYPMPGDAAQATMEWAVLDVTTRDVVRQQDEPCVIVHPAGIAYQWWSGEKGDAVHFLRHSRDARTLELRRLDPATGEVTTLISESGATRIDPTPQLGEPAMVHVLDSGEILWWSQRDGWGHLYLYSADGEHVAQVTSGQWLVRKVLWVDQEARQVWFLASGLVEHDPYVRQICRVGFDGTGFTRLTDDDLDHDAVSPAEGGYLVDRASTVSAPPRSVVLGGDGQVLVELEAPDAGRLESVGWRPPERFRTTAADGKTSIHGLLWRPHGFDPDHRYPVIDCIYPGPQVHRSGPAFDSAVPGEAEALAALGFAVVAVDGRGTAGRGKAFHDHSYGALDEAGSLVDHIAAIRELGHRHPWLDTERVGITGHSGGGFATARAMLAHPEFYSVGVALAGNHDMGVYVPMWPEQYHGEINDESKRALSNPALAANLQGKLLLIHGELDDNVLPAHTLRLVDALIEADKDVDVLLIPGDEHALLRRKHYVTRRTWDYFVRHLHGTEPPAHRLAPHPLPLGEGF
ncbi:prolyl oligopeptidase family serine peptidase [Saccharopolyspora sp. NFXS83]|uniref:S9 family peptidase n=1 Tax=Saccharopolyspora sp. NFXS83 TaxID=2993560 RepID=UPI00224B3892|nr:prolyl oligopeptidase family serine peptidase [Saccharopolyspora sp. NFXS83]MCX2731572.1 prolyl oligopeptidase family serine peptidase [Saccharopolyspora sp. NFXS83]